MRENAPALVPRQALLRFFGLFSGGKPMPSNAFMEVAPLDIVGESGDIAVGKDTPYAMFEIFSVDFETGSSHSSKTSESTTVKGKDGQSFKVNVNVPTAQTPTKSSAENQQDRAGHITIHKAIDYASPDLFRYCCENAKSDSDKKIAWAIIYIREAGGATKAEDIDNPWLRIELTNVRITHFSWDLDPGGGADELNKTEKIDFEFDKMMVYYYQQQKTGLHSAGDKEQKINQWNFADQNANVAPLS
jgi:type VI protein secretion system component Hcp